MTQEKAILREYPVTVFLVAVNLIMFAVCEITGGSESTQVLLNWGALCTPLRTSNAYRLLTALFLHAGIRHLLNNMLLLCVLGSRVEKMTGRLRYLLIYLGGGLLANAACAFYYEWQGESLVLVGASGCIFGLMGSLLWIVIRNRGRAQDLTVRSLFIMAALSLYFGFASSGTANAAHVFGLIFGFLFTVLLYRRNRNGVY